jgi:hypothetical protein
MNQTAGDRPTTHPGPPRRQQGGAHGGTRGSPVLLGGREAGNQAGLRRGRERASADGAVGRTGRLGKGTQARLLEIAKFTRSYILLAYPAFCFDRGNPLHRAIIGGAHLVARVASEEN